MTWVQSRWMSSGFAQRDRLATCVWFLVPQRGTLCCTHNSRLFPGIESMLLKRFSINCIRWWMTSRTGLDCWGGERAWMVYTRSTPIAFHLLRSANLTCVRNPQSLLAQPYTALLRRLIVDLDHWCYHSWCHWGWSCDQGPY